MMHPADILLKDMRSLTNEDRELVKRAYDFAKEAHGEQKRLSGENYFDSHIMTTTRFLVEAGMDPETVAAGLLHDTLEDTDTTPETLKKEFGEEVLFLVEGVTRLGELKYRGLERHVESVRRLLVATASDIRVILIKLYDRLHNMQTNEYHEPARRKRKALETMEIYVPIAERLGIGVLKAQLEDLAFKELESKRYEELSQYLKDREKDAHGALEQVKKELKKELAKHGLRNFRIESRVKNVHSFAKKLDRKNGDADRIHDIFAIRIIVKGDEDCYHALGIVHNKWRPVIGRVKDYIAVPKPNGYRSLHTTIITQDEVTIEVQIRTEQMQREAKFGIASQFNYKHDASSMLSSAAWLYDLMPSLMKKDSLKKRNGEIPHWLKELTEIESDHPEYETFEELLKQDFLRERMFVFTPKGDVIDLPVGATPVDFAYSIHSDVGNTMAEAKINGKLTSLDTPLKNGDVVEIITKKNAKPNKKWIEFVKTATAKSRIRSALKKDE